MHNWRILPASLLLVLAASVCNLAQVPEPPPAQAQTQPIEDAGEKTNNAAAPVQPKAVWAGKLERWLEVQTASLTLRYRFVEDARGVTTANQMQDQDVFKARLKFDAGGRFSLNAGVASGTQFVASWNNTGVGTGRAVTNLYLKQLYFAAQPVRGVELQYGGLGILRGESTEITGYDNDGFVTGQRIILRRPKQFFFD